MTHSLFVHGLAVLTLAPLLSGSAAGAELARHPGMRLTTRVIEVLDADPPETATVDSVVVDALYDTETSFRAGPFMLYVKGVAVDDASVDMAYSLYTYGPAIGAPVFDRVRVPYGLPLVVENLQGKGKSRYRVLVTPERAEVEEPSAPPPSDSTHWESGNGTYYRHNAVPFALAHFHYAQLHAIIDGELEAIRDTFGITTPGRVNVFLTEGESREFPFDPRFGFAVDPTRNRVIGLYRKDSTGFDTQALLLNSLYREWGYAPELLALGASGYFLFSDFDVMLDRSSGQSIPLDSIVNTVAFRRHDPQSAFHHAASFTGWLIRTHGLSKFRELYTRATDLSLPRAIWAGYGKTLAELEADWHAWLGTREFSATEFWRYSIRARYFHRLVRHLEMALNAAAVADSLIPGLWRDLALAQGHQGHWNDAVGILRGLVDARPDILVGYSLLGEALWARGDWVSTGLVFKQALARDSSVTQAWMRLGDIQADQRRQDSAAVLWTRALASASGLALTDLHVRLGRYERRQGNRDAAREHFTSAALEANLVAHENAADPAVWYQLAAAYLGLDSVQLALEHLQGAEYLSDAVLDLGMVHLIRGNCYDVLEQRSDAVAEYQAALAIKNVPYAIETKARAYINRPYRWEEIDQRRRRP